LDIILIDTINQLLVQKYQIRAVVKEQ